MRTTFNLDDDLFEVLKSYAKSRSLTIGKAASELVRHGLNAPIELRLENGFYSVVLCEDSPKISSDTVKRLLEDET